MAVCIAHTATTLHKHQEGWQPDSDDAISEDNFAVLVGDSEVGCTDEEVADGDE